MRGMKGKADCGTACARTSLEVGFADGALPPRLAAFRGRVWRSVGAADDLPFEDAQFDVVMLAAEAVSRQAAKEAHRVLRPDGCLRFVVPERTRSQSGWTLPDVYSVVRDGFHIVEAARTAPRWMFWRGRRELAICARKKAWKSLRNSYRPYL